MHRQLPRRTVAVIIVIRMTALASVRLTFRLSLIGKLNVERRRSCAVSRLCPFDVRHPSVANNERLC